MKPVIEVYQRQGKSKKWSWRLVGGNTQIVATPQKGFPTMEHASANARECKATFSSATSDDIRITGHDRFWRWIVILLGDNRVFPHQSFTSERGVGKSIQRVNRIFKKAKIKILGS